MSHTSINEIAIALVVKRFNEEKGRKTQNLGRTTLQKLIYFLQNAEVPVSYRFTPYHYGPFSARLLDDVDELLLDGVVDDASDDEDKSIYLPTDNTVAFLKEHAKEANDLEPKVNDIVLLFSQLFPSQMELVASIHMVFEILKAGTDKDKTVSDEEIVNGIESWKPGRFKKEEVVDFIKQLRAHKLIS